MKPLDLVRASAEPVEPADLTDARTYSVQARATKVRQHEFAGLLGPGASLSAFLESLPRILKANELRQIVDAIARAYEHGKPVILGMGGHVIKCGLSPLIIQLIERKVLSGICMNGGASIHDFEVATLGTTSEDVAAGLEEGMFGMVKETGETMNQAIDRGAILHIGLGRALGLDLVERHAPSCDVSVLAAGIRSVVPVMVHVAIGGDTIHMHPTHNPAALAETSFRDFRILVSILKNMGDGGVYLNAGSAVILPEVSLKALNLARNVANREIKNFTTINLDMVQHYRPLENVVRRPNQKATGTGFTLTGHHEIMLPLLFHLILAKIGNG